jgi:hypothetical protein
MVAGDHLLLGYDPLSQRDEVRHLESVRRPSVGVCAGSLQQRVECRRHAIRSSIDRVKAGPQLLDCRSVNDAVLHTSESLGGPLDKGERRREVVNSRCEQFVVALESLAARLVHFRCLERESESADEIEAQEGLDELRPFVLAAAVPVELPAAGSMYVPEIAALPFIGVLLVVVGVALRSAARAR